MGIGNSKSKKGQKEPDKFFERERWKEQKRDEKRKKNANHANRRGGTKEAPVTPAVMTAPPPPGPSPLATPAHVRSYDDEALDRMRFQLHNDSDKFLLNNILLSVQFFENYEREVHQIKNNPISEREHSINEAMVRENKHVFFADRFQETVHEHVCYQRSRGRTEPLSAPRLFVIYDNVEASEPGDTSDYSAVLDAPFYKLRIEDCKETGYIRLKKLEVLESTLHKEIVVDNTKQFEKDDSLYTDSEKESNDSDENSYSANKGTELLQQIKSQMINKEIVHQKINKPVLDNTNAGRRYSGPIKQVSLQVTKSDISNIERLRNDNSFLTEEVTENNTNVSDRNDDVPVPRKSILKNKNQNIDTHALSDSTIVDDTETSGYRSNSSRQTESSENDSDYGYATITESATPKKIELSVKCNYSQTSGVLPDEIWTVVETKAMDEWTDDEDDEINDNSSKVSLTKNLFEKFYYLNSIRFMNNFVDNFIITLGSGLGLTQDEVNSSLTQGASIYCDSTKNNAKIAYEIFPALVAAWPNAANQWIIRERRIIQNPRTNFSYQWPTKYMVNKAIGYGCLLVPIGFRPKRGQNPDQALQWRIIFPAAERYLDSCLAHSHIRCYLFTLALHKTFLENESAKIGIDASHIKNHLFWQCEDNYAKWPEDRLGETLKLFLRSLYSHFGQYRMPNYFVSNCNEFKSIPKPVLTKVQRRLADILEAPVMHTLYALNKLKYIKRDFYPPLNIYRLYDILTCKNPLRIINPHIPVTISNHHLDNSSDSEEDSQVNFWDKAKAHDKHYQWKKERQRQMQERRKIQMQNKRQKSLGSIEREINKNIILPNKMETERRRLVLEFFIPHFIAMARSSERFDAIRQAVIYLEQAHRLCRLLLEEPGGDNTANEFLDVVQDKLADCQRKLVTQGGYKLPPRRENSTDRAAPRVLRKQRPRFDAVNGQDSPTGSGNGFTFVDVHADTASHEHNMTLQGSVNTAEESKL